MPQLELQKGDVKCHLNRLWEDVQKPEIHLDAKKGIEREFHKQITKVPRSKRDHGVGRSSCMESNVECLGGQIGTMMVIHRGLETKTPKSENKGRK